MGGGQASLNLFNAEQNQRKLASQLSSGLRVQSAPDDPSGLAISESMHSRIAGLQQGVSNTQTANNLLSVADEAAANITSILQRMHSLVIEAGSDLLSLGDLQHIQTEIEALAKEIDSIASNANFNGVKLFDGSHDTYVGASSSGLGPVPATVIMVTPPTDPDGSIPVTRVVNPQGMPAQLVQNARMGSWQETEGYWLLQVTGYSTNPTDPMLGPLGQPGVYLRGVEYSTDPNFAGGTGGQENISTQAVPTNAGWDFSSGGSLQVSTPGNWIGDFTNIAFDMPNLSPGDVGAAAAFVTIDARQSGGGTALDVNTTGQEGGDVAISLPTLSAKALDVSRLSVLPPTQYDEFDNVTGTDSSNQYAVADSLARVQYAIDQMGQVRAQLGAQSVSLQAEADNSSTQTLNLQTAQSGIRDLDLGAAMTQFTKDNILVSVNTSVQAQMNSDSSLVLQLFR